MGAKFASLSLSVARGLQSELVACAASVDRVAYKMVFLYLSHSFFARLVCCLLSLTVYSLEASEISR